MRSQDDHHSLRLPRRLFLLLRLHLFLFVSIEHPPKRDSFRPRLAQQLEQRLRHEQFETSLPALGRAGEERQWLLRPVDLARELRDAILLLSAALRALASFGPKDRWIDRTPLRDRQNMPLRFGQRFAD